VVSKPGSGKNAVDAVLGRTETISDNADPVWKPLSIPLPPLDTPLFLQCFDDDPIGADLIGQASFLPNAAVQAPVTIPLTLNNKPAGTIILSAKVQTPTAPTPTVATSSPAKPLAASEKSPATAVSQPAKPAERKSSTLTLPVAPPSKSPSSKTDKFPVETISSNTSTEGPLWIEGVESENKVLCLLSDSSLSLWQWCLARTSLFSATKASWEKP
jgi:hypothetical protein